jgi:hypothetical protein
MGEKFRDGQGYFAFFAIDVLAVHDKEILQASPIHPAAIIAHGN